MYIDIFICIQIGPSQQNKHTYHSHVWVLPKEGFLQRLWHQYKECKRLTDLFLRSIYWSRILKGGKTKKKSQLKCLSKWKWRGKIWISILRHQKVGCQSSGKHSQLTRPTVRKSRTMSPHCFPPAFHTKDQWKGSAALCCLNNKLHPCPGL